MNKLFEAGLEIQRFLQARKWRFCFIGGLSVIRWGRPRMTQDIDLTLLTGFGQEEEYIRPLLASFRSRTPDAESFAITNRILLLTASNGVAVDVSMGGIPLEESMIERATAFEFESGCELMTCSAEDLLILKAFAGRTQDWADVENIALRQGNRLDATYILRHLTPLCELKGTPDSVAAVQRLLTHGQSDPDLRS